MGKRSFLTLFIILSAALPGISFAQVETPRNPDSAKECAICHYRWVDTFYIDNRGSELVEYQSEKVVAKSEMCFTCHDGSVVDSREKIYNDYRHKINKPPPADMKIPANFPLDKDGNIQCSTCHTAHGVSSEMGIEKTIFIRESNKNSGICIMCHSDKDGGTEKGNHPVGPSEKKIPDSLIAHGSRLGDQKNHIICETCHTAHGSPNESFLIESARNSELCLECHADKKIFTSEGNRNHLHVINVKPSKVVIPPEVIDSGAKLGDNGELICQTCHKIHNNRIEKKLLLIMKDGESSLCLTCHKDKSYLAETKHNLMHSAPDEKNLAGNTVAEAGMCSACHLPHKRAREADEDLDYTTQLCLSCHSKGSIAEESIPPDYRHPVELNPFEENKKSDLILNALGVKKEDLALPLFNKTGIQDKNGKITCATCHDPHRWRSDSTEGEIRKDIKGNKKTSFLRKAEPELCRECHSNKFYIANSKHDIEKVAPDEINSSGQTPAESGLCGVCHMVHGGQKSYLWARKVEAGDGMVIEDLCTGCHNEKGNAGKKVIKDHSHPVNISPGEKGLSTTLPLFDDKGNVSEDGKMTCETCHDPHRWDPVNIIEGDHYKEIEGNAQNSFLRVENYPSPGLCSNCHPDQALIEKTDHDLIVSAPEARNNIDQKPAESGTCGVCHITHNNRNKIKLWAQGLSEGSSIMDMMCNACHSKDGSAENKIPEIYSHPEGQLIINHGHDKKTEPNYFPIYDQWSGSFTSVGNISCPSCHNVHQWDPRFINKGTGINVEGTASNSFLRGQTYSLLCIDCHGLDALFRFKYYHDPEERVESSSVGLK
jgi:predicted CXXCH cytochrome family protein